jgi:hypothetical protein
VEEGLEKNAEATLASIFLSVENLALLTHWIRILNPQLPHSEVIREVIDQIGTLLNWIIERVKQHRFDYTEG